MASLPLSEILNAVRQLPNEYGINQTPWINPALDNQGTDLTRVRKISGNSIFDTGPIEQGISVYSSEEQKKIGDAAPGVSPDVLAWYVSFHSNAYLWGIYLSRKGIYSVANSLTRGGVDSSMAINLAKKFLIRHESTHFQTDLGITSLELALNKPIYLHARHKIAFDVPAWNLTEEGFANSLARRALKTEKNSINSFLDSSPAGYSDWRKFNSSSDAWTWNKIIYEIVLPISSVSNYELASETSNVLAVQYFNDIPVYEVDDVSSSESDLPAFIGPISIIHETDDFLKDLKKLLRGQPSYKKKWENTKKKLASGNTVGVHLEIINKKKNIHSVQIDGEARAGIQKNEYWLAIAAGHHDELYRRLNSK